MPGFRPATPEAIASGRSVPARASPSASIAAPSELTAVSKSPEKGDVVAEREVDDAVALAGRGAQHVKIPDIAAANLGAGAGDGDGLGGRVRPRQAEDLVIGCEQLGHDGGADPARRAGDEYAHGMPPISGASGAGGGVKGGPRAQDAT